MSGPQPRPLARLGGLAASLLLLAFAPNPTQGLVCKTVSSPCEFPFSHDNIGYSECIRLEAAGDSFACPVGNDNITGAEKQWGVCGSGCLSGDGEAAINFGGDGGGTAAMSAIGSLFCKSRRSRCVFPFEHEGDVYEECAGQDGDFAWCATAVDDEGKVVDGQWARCDLGTCTEDEPGPIVAEAVFSDQNGISGTIRFEQADEEAPLRITGELVGLPPGHHGFHVHEGANDGDNCTAAGPHFNPFKVDHGYPGAAVKHVGDLGNISVPEPAEAGAPTSVAVDITVTQASLFDPERNVLGRSLVIHERRDDLGASGDASGAAGARLACAVIREPSDWDMNLIIIIVLVVVAVLLLLLVCCLCYCCCCRKKDRRKKKANGKDDPDGAYADGNGHAGKTKVPLYDELSIPFIDASPAPTPKTGRSTERLSFFRSSSVGRSRGSLSSETK